MPDTPASYLVPFCLGSARLSLLQISLESGLLVIGHEKGEVRVYQFSQVANEATSVELSGPNRKASHEEESGRCGAHPGHLSKCKPDPTSWPQPRSVQRHFGHAS